MCKIERFLHESLLKIGDFFQECEKICFFFTSGAQWNELKDEEFLTQVEEIPDLQQIASVRTYFNRFTAPAKKGTSNRPENSVL